ncbi:lactonase family protein [Pseudomonas sp. RIT-PI-S]|uniref:lactonase family protein n=1 Tax=Pseudomonas sp. RIT-PI-S TaxID=3035295 RepID=UPI0021DAA46A|nr:lactonase family protein [Pseudomonas sp. RIT-PI-S]
MLRVLMSLTLAGAALGSSLAQATTYDLLVGSYTQGSSEGLYRLSFDSQSGQLASAPVQVIKADNPSWLVLNKAQSQLFVVNENGPGQKDTVGRVSSYRIDPATHEVALINQVQSKGDEPTHASLSADEKWLFVSNYAVHPDPGGSLAVLPVAADGTLGEVAQQFHNAPSKVNPERQASGHVHSTVSNHGFVYSSDLGADKVFVYRAQGKATAPLSPANPAAVALPPGSGPRHLLFDASGEHAWLTLEMPAQVASFKWQAGNLVRTQLHDLATEQKPATGAGGGLHLSPDGKFLYVANRGTVNELVVYAVDHEGGLKQVQRRSVEGDHPREFTLDPSGRFVLIANQKSNEIVVVERDAASGMLQRTVQHYPLDSPSDLKFLQPAH